MKMKIKISIALSLAVIVNVVLTSLVLAADPPAYVAFTTDAPCAVTVLVTSYTNPANQSGQTASGLTPWTLDTFPLTSVTFFYPASVVCGGTTYDFTSISPGNPLPSGTAGSTTTVTGHYVLSVPDTTPPVWTVPADFSVEATGPAGAVITYTASVSDPDDVVSSQSCIPASSTPFPLGTTTVNCTATDTHGNTGTANFSVTVVDTTPPTLTLPSDMTVWASSASGAVVSYTASANDLVDGPVAMTCSPASGSLFPIGKTAVNCSATDAHGNTGTGSFNVTVVDNVPPVLTLPSDITVSAQNASGAVVNFTVSANDLVDGSVAVTCSPASGSLFPIGQTAVNCSATDAHGNTGTGGFGVTVIIDNVPPVLTLPSDITVSAQNASGAMVTFTVSATDAVDGPVPVTCLLASGSMFPIGTTTVNCSATDSHGNTASGSFTVTVQYAIGGKCNGVPGHQILEPINTDGSSVFKAGSTVPAKFRVCGEDDEAIATPGIVSSFKLIEVISETGTTYTNEDPVSTTSDPFFRSGNRQWIFNINTKNLSASNTYVYLITLNDGSTIQFQFTLK